VLYCYWNSMQRCDRLWGINGLIRTRNGMKRSSFIQVWIWLLQNRIVSHDVADDEGGSVCGYFVTSQYHTLHTRHARLRVVFAFAWRKTIFLFFQKPCRKPLPSYPKLNISSANETNREIDIGNVDPRITCPGRLRFVVKKLV
jgi:hypothetical protein